MYLKNSRILFLMSLLNEKTRNNERRRRENGDLQHGIISMVLYGNLIQFFDDLTLGLIKKIIFCYKKWVSTKVEFLVGEKAYTHAHTEF